MTEFIPSSCHPVTWSKQIKLMSISLVIRCEGKTMKPIRIGVVGCGAIAQVHHMPNLHALQELFEVTAVCDVSAGAAAYVAKRFNVPQHFTDYRDLLATDV